jgi:HAD superfamily hydrolase (TIGR01509 family)
MSRFLKRAIIFDFGGVLMKTLDYGPRHTWDDRLGLPHGSAESIVHGSAIWHKAQLGLVPVAEYWAAVAQQLGISPEQIPQFERDYFSGDQLDSSLIALIRHLKGSGHRTALLSNDSPALDDKLADQGIADLFDPVVISAHIGVMKPDPAAYQALLDALNCPENQTIFIDDRLENVLAARALGMHGIHYIQDMDVAAALEPLLMMTGGAG